MVTDHAPSATIRRAVLLFDEPRLIIEYADGRTEQISGAEAITRWQCIRQEVVPVGELQVQHDSLLAAGSEGSAV